MNNQTASQTDKWAARRERFMLDPLPVRLGELAVALASAKSGSDHPAHCKVVKLFLDESAHYLEWSAPETDPGLQSELAELRQLLAQWRENWQAIWDDQVERESVAAQAGAWSQKILDRSGLAEYDDWQMEFDYPPGIRAAAESLV